MENPGALLKLIPMEKLWMENGQTVIQDVQELVNFSIFVLFLSRLLGKLLSGLLKKVGEWGIKTLLIQWLAVLSVIEL